MTIFTESEQYYSDLDWFAVDKNGLIAQFTTGANRLLPSVVAQNKENWQVLFSYFEQLKSRSEFEINSDLRKHIADKLISGLNNDINRFIQPYSKMSEIGLFAFDSFPKDSVEGDYFLVTSPTVKLTLDDMPDHIAEILENQRFETVDFEVCNSIDGFLLEEL